MFTYTDTTFYIAANGIYRGSILNVAAPSLGAAVAQPVINIYRSDNPSTLPGVLADTSTGRALTALNNITRVFDYYRDVLSRNSFDGVGDGSPINVTILPDNFVNAVQFVLAQETGFAFGYGLEGAVDVVGHEFTHAVIAHVVQTLPSIAAGHLGLAYNDESGALNESFADILGALIENEEGIDRWLIGEDSSYGIPFRDMSNPTAYNQPDNYGDYENTPYDNGGVHVNSGIFNYAAYQMMTDSRTAAVSSEQWSEVFYGALYRLAPNAKFIDGRAAVIASAKAAGLTIAQRQAVEDAFDAVGIVDGDAQSATWWGTSSLDSPASTFLTGGRAGTILL